MWNREAELRLKVSPSGAWEQGELFPLNPELSTPMIRLIRAIRWLTLF